MSTKIENRKGNRKTSKTKKAISLMFSLSLIVAMAAGILGGMYAPGTVIASPPETDQVEPEAGTWKTWVLESGSQLRVPAPPLRNETEEEIETQ